MPPSAAQVYLAHSVRGTAGEWDNRPLVARILELRREKARLLGFADFADLVLEDRMAHNGARAMAFLEDLKAKTERRFREENRELLEFRRSLEGPDAPELEPWDVAYYAEKQRAALYDFDEEALRPYFPLERVTAGLFDLVNRLYGIRVSEEPGVPVWDPQVRYYNIHDEDGAFLGGFYADWYPRENKRGGGWMDALITGGPAAGGFHPHLGLICGNLTPPVGGRPALLTHREVETIFHEFGHLLHHLLSRVEIRTLAGTNVAWDFVELPSQIMENWCWERQALDLFARHWETGEPIPDALFQKMKRARTFRAANAQMRQLGFGFCRPAPAHPLFAAAGWRPGGVHPAPLAGIRARAAAARARHDRGLHPPVWQPGGLRRRLLFLQMGRSAGCRRVHPLSGPWASSAAKSGSEFREKILSKGDSEDPAELYRSFMGRDPDPQALLERSGLA